MRPRRAAAATLVVLAWLAALACASAPVRPDARPAAAPAEPAFEPLGRAFFLQQAVVARFDEQEKRFEIALQSRCHELRLVGLSPFGMRLFSAVRDEAGLRVESFAGAALPFEPERVLRDVERTFFRSQPVAGDADRLVRFAGETIRETWRDGRLAARSIAVSEDPQAPPLRIRYSGPLLAAGISERVDLSNPVFGYALEIHNHHVEELRCGLED